MLQMSCELLFHGSMKRSMKSVWLPSDLMCEVDVLWSSDPDDNVDGFFFQISSGTSNGENGEIDEICIKDVEKRCDCRCGWGGDVVGMVAGQTGSATWSYHVK